MFDIFIDSFHFEKANCVIKKNLNELCNSCEIALSDFKTNSSFFNSKKVEVFYKKYLIFSGFVDSISKKALESETNWFVSSRCKLANLVDCDFSFVKSNSSFFDLLKFLQKTYDFEYTTDCSNIPLKDCNFFGDNIYYVLGDIARKNNLILFSDSKGRLNIKKLKSDNNKTQLDENANLIEYEFMKNQSVGFGKYICKNSKISAFLNDKKQDSIREKIIIDNSVESLEDLNKILELEKMKNNIYDVVALVRFNDWVGENVFEINQKIFCNFPSLNNEKKRYLISSLEFRSSDFTTEITLINL